MTLSAQHNVRMFLTEQHKLGVITDKEYNKGLIALAKLRR